MANEEQAEATRDGGRAKLKKLAVGAAVLIGAFLLGYVPSWMSAREAREQKARLEAQLQLAELRGQLGMMSYEANRNNYASATQFSTEFFNGLREAVNRTQDAARKEQLAAVMARRDEITANLAEANPAVKEKLQQMYAEFFQITKGQ